jgi:hypothetical protein
MKPIAKRRTDRYNSSDEFPFNINLLLRNVGNAARWGSSTHLKFVANDMFPCQNYLATTFIWRDLAGLQISWKGDYLA